MGWKLVWRGKELKFNSRLSRRLPNLLLRVLVRRYGIRWQIGSEIRIDDEGMSNVFETKRRTADELDLLFMCLGWRNLLRSPQAWIERVAQAIAQKIKGKHGHR